MALKSEQTGELEFHPGKIKAILKEQKQHFQQDPMPSLQSRQEKLKALRRALLSCKHDLCQSVKADFGHRNPFDTQLSDILPCLSMIDYSLKRLKKWMQPSRREAGLKLFPARVMVHYQPVGVVGIIVPWNVPINLSVIPLITAIAAGNRAMIKLSEFTPHTNQVIKAMLQSIFKEEEVAVVEGDEKVAAAFSALPFDHLLFTGSVEVGKKVMRAASANLTPVTLELGGKSPLIIAPDANMDTAVERLVWGKSINSGQACVAPDYVLIQQDKRDELVSTYQKQFQRCFPNGVASPDYTSVINEKQYQRINRLIDDAEAKGAIRIAAGSPERNDSKQRMVTQLFVDVTDDMALMSEEIFGPLLPIVTYNHIDEALQFIRERPRPLALYLMSNDQALQERVVTTMHSGGMCINDTIVHVGVDDAPFGGTGTSGMGRYHGHEGFLTLSHAKTVVTKSRFNTARLALPPYSTLLHKFILKWFVR